MTDNIVPIRRSKPVARPVPEVRRSIGGLAYDTTTASVLFHWRVDDNPDEWNNPYGDQIGGVLLVNKWGHYFALEYNYWREPWDDGYETIKPLTRQEAIAWAEKHCVFIVEELFGVMPEAGEGAPYEAKDEP